jgi:hypothetical protein
VLKARVNLANNLSSVIKDSAKKRANVIDDVEKKLTNVCRTTDAILKELYEEMKLEQSHPRLPTEAEQYTSSCKRKISCPTIITCETPARKKMPPVLVNQLVSMNKRSHLEDIDTAMDEEDDTSHDKNGRYECNSGCTTSTARVAVNTNASVQLPTTPTPFPAATIKNLGELKFNIGSAGPSYNKKQKKLSRKSNYKI